MSKQKLQKIIVTFVPVLIGVLLIIPTTVYGAEGIIERVAISGINNIIAGVGNFFLMLASQFVSITGTFLSVSINITTHLDQLYEKVTAIQSVWRTIRDISSIFIIFSLLYFSIRTILGVEGGSLGKLIVKIFLAGVFINFSLFFFKVAIDASNIISLQFYRAVAPNTEQNWKVGEAFNSGGLSNIFMQSLKIPVIYKNTGVLKTADVSLGIGLAVYGGIILMVIAGVSFLAAAIAFTARTAILLFCLAMSPIYFVGLIFPEIKRRVSDKLIDLFYGQLVFMPVYLFLLYIALRIISDPAFTGIFNSDSSGTADPNGFGPVWIGVIIQYTIAIFFINLPLLAAIDLGGRGMKWAGSAASIASRMTGGWGKSFASALGRNTAGRAGKFAGEQFDSMAASAQGNKYGRAATSVLRNLGISQAVRGKLSDVEKSKYFGSQSLGDVEKEDKDRAKEVRKVSNIKNLEAAIAAGSANDINKILSKMSSSEIGSLKTKYLTNSHVVPHLTSSVYSNVDKGDKSDEDKVKIKAARYNELTNAGVAGNTIKAGQIMKNFSGEELLEYVTDSTAAGTAVLHDAFIENLKPNQLKKMENLDKVTRRNIGNTILNWHATHPGHHASRDYINNNQALWS